MNNKSFLRSLLIVLSITLLTSCDKDFNEIGSGIIGDEHFGFEKDSSSTVLAFNQSTGVVQTNNLLVNSLGLYYNEVFGKTRANFVTQLEMASPNPTFDLTLQSTGQIVLDSVVLTIPYFSKVTETAEDGKRTYELDSINGSGAIDLKIFESGYYLTDLDPSLNFEEAQKYYSNQDAAFDGVKGIQLNNSSNTIENTQFIPSAKEFVKFQRDNLLFFTTDEESRATPRMSLHLNKDFFKTKIIDAPADKLLNNNSFKDYFRGLYFQVADATNGQLIKMDFLKGDITLYYTEYEGLEDKDNDDSTPETPITFDHDDNSETAEVVKKILKSYVLNLRGNTVNLLQQTNNTGYANAIAASNPTTSDEKLYLKGGAGGSVVLIDIFTPQELESIRNSGWLVNEANLSFYIDTETMGAVVPEPERIYLYDANNSRPLVDYFSDNTSATDPKLNKSIHGGIIEKEDIDGGRGIKYKIRITNHIRNLVNNPDSTNVRLGLSVTEYINYTSNSSLKTTVNGVDRIPAASVMNQLGTILYGSNPIVPENKRLKLEIYYTKPN